MAIPAPRTVNVYGSDAETTPLAVFETPITVEEIRRTLGLAKGGLKRKNAQEIFTNNLNAGGDFTFIGGPKFVISVTFMGVTAMVNVKSPKSKVRALINEIAAHFASLVSGDPDETKITELKTGGILMNLNDVIDNVLVDGASVDAVDFKTWSAAILKSCETNELKVLQAELDGESSDKWAEVGFVKGTPKVFVKLGCGYQKNAKAFKLEILDVDALQHFPKDGRHLITFAGGANKAGGKYAIEAHVRVAGGVVVAIELSVRASTSKRAAIREIPVKIADGAIKFGEPVTLQSDNPVVERKFNLPAPTSTGPNLEAVAAADAKLPKEKVAPTQSFAANGLNFTVNCPGVYAEQRTGRGDEWFQCYYFSLELQNPDENNVTITTTKIEYQAADGNWVAAKNENVHCGSHNGGWRFDWDWRGSTGGKFYVRGKDVTKNAMRAAFGMPKSIPCGERRRTHRSLPQPLKLRLTFNTVEGKTATLEVAQVNDEPLDLATKESREKYHSGKTITKFITCDDCDAETRTFVEVFPPDTSNGYDYLAVGWPGSSKYVYLSDTRKWAYDAIAEGKSEVKIDDIKHEEGSKKLECYGLVDAALGSVYALRFELSTSTSKVVDHVLIPHLKTPYD